MRINLAICFLALIFSANAGALTDDATLSRLLVGRWHQYRHDTQYLPNGTWIMDPPDDGSNTRGKWHIEHGKLITTWRFVGEASDSMTVDEISELTRSTLKFRTLSQEGPGRPEGLVFPSSVYTLMRVTKNK